MSNSYDEVMARKSEIMKKSVGIDYSIFESGSIAFDYERMMKEKPEKAIELAVKGMLPKNSLGRSMYRKLKVYSGPEHNHEAQKPVVYEF